jgi:hypothetical protein
MTSGEHLDLSSEPEGQPSHAARPAAERAFLGIHFACCGVYARVYINRDRTAYLGHCPRCSRRVQLRVGPGGSDSLFFTAH